MTFEYQFNKEDAGSDPPPNTGVLVYLQEPHRVWPACLEVQGRFDQMGNIKSNSRSITVEASDDEEARLNTRKAVGEWNAIEVHSQNGALTAKLNGVVVCRSKPTEIQTGLLGLQAENFAVKFRNLQIKEED